MFRIQKINQYFISFGVPILMMLSLIFIVRSSVFEMNSDALSLAITLDLLLTIPLIYYLLIRKTKTPKTTLAPILIIGSVVGTLILPTEQQYYLNLFKTWGLPLVELAMISIVIFKVRKTIKKYKEKKEESPDFFNALKNTCYELLPKKAAIPFATEIGVFYFGFIHWKKGVLKENEFTYHKQSGTITLLIAIIFIIAIETYVLHILLMRWNVIAAWILTVLSLYSGIQIFGFLKSMTKRPIALKKHQLHIFYGILSETVIDLTNIETVTVTSKEIEFDNKTCKLSPLGTLESHNIIIKLNNENTLIGYYGITKKFKKLALYVDNPQGFKHQIEKNLKLDNSII